MYYRPASIYVGDSSEYSTSQKPSGVLACRTVDKAATIGQVLCEAPRNMCSTVWVDPSYFEQVQ